MAIYSDRFPSGSNEYMLEFSNRRLVFPDFILHTFSIDFICLFLSKWWSFPSHCSTREIFPGRFSAIPSLAGTTMTTFMTFSESGRSAPPQCSSHHVFIVTSTKK